LTCGVTHSAPVQEGARFSRSIESPYSLAASTLGDPPDETESAVPNVGITVYGCAPDEALLFREMAPRLGVVPTLTESAVSAGNLELALGNRCISVGHRTHVTNPTLLALGEAGVEYISTRSAGFDHIDVQCAASVGICVENVAYSPHGVADYTLMLMLMVVRNAKPTVIRAQRHDYSLDDERSKELRDMTVGVIGTGRIGAAVIDRLQGFGCRVLAYDRCPNAVVEYVPLAELLGHSDVVTLHTPLNADTRHLLNHQRLEQMRYGALIINTGRGALLDTAALLSALESGRLGGAALDVLEGEEGVFYSDHSQRHLDHRLLLRLQQLPNVLITPHTAYYTDHALSDTVQNTLLNCLRFERGAAWRG
jgi:D-specific alpha-keto acid dehydrogenase